MKTKILKLLCIIAVIIAVVWYINWMSDRDQRLMHSAEAYERCVFSKYQTTPAAWYWEHNEYPECDVNSYLLSN